MIILHPIIFGLILFGWLPPITLTSFFLMEMSFLNLILFYLRPLFEERNWSVKQWFTLYQIKEYS